MESSSYSLVVRTLRCRMGWSQSEMAMHLGVPTVVVRAWEIGAENPTVDQLQKIEGLFRQSESSMHDLQQTPTAESLLESGTLESVNLHDLSN